jgi:outer membrane protein OmpA-like peptidoglycan-associated protein
MRGSLVHHDSRESSRGATRRWESRAAVRRSAPGPDDFRGTPAEPPQNAVIRCHDFAAMNCLCEPDSVAGRESRKSRAAGRGPAFPPFAALAALSCAGVLIGACRPFVMPEESVPLPPRNESVSFYVAEHASVDRARFRPIAFAPGKYLLTPLEESRLRGIVGALGREERLLLAGIGADESSPEWNRVLSERRALEVRNALMRAGLDASRIQTASSGADIVGNGGGGRVEIGVIK